MLPNDPSPAWVRPLREKALSRFDEIGFPTTRHEEWKYTNVGPFVREPFQVSLEPYLDGLTSEKIRPFLFGKTAGPVLVFVNGIYARNLSKVGATHASPLHIMSLAAALCESPDLVEPYLARLVPYDENGFTALNTAYVRDGFFLRVPEGVEVKDPIQILFVAAPPKDRLIFQPRNLIVLEKGARARVVESYISWGQSPKAGTVPTYFTNAVTEVVLKKDSSLDHDKIQKEDGEKGHHVATTRVRLEEGSRFSSFVISLGAKLARENLSVFLEGERTECILNGLYLVSKGRHVDHHTVMDHLKPRGKSRQLYKGVVSGKSTAVFNGKVFVRENAVKSDAEQTNKNLLLSEDAMVDTKPQLEIDNDDVKCTHGAAVGQLDDEQIFYLRSRGVTEAEARSILTYAFVSEVLEKIEFEPVREALKGEVHEWL